MRSLGPTWERLEPIASGGLGRVWRARHRATGTLVALKQLIADTRPGDLLHEVRAVAHLDHPGIIAIHDWGEAPQPWFTMELAVSSLKSDPPTTWADVRGVLRQVLDALAHAHARGVLHLDIKPANVLRAPAGHWWLADFGIARFRERASLGTSSAGTPGYMAPEQIRADPIRLGPETDLYALGCLGWTLVTGAPPFGRTFAPVDHALPPLRPHIPVPPGAEDWLRRLVAAPTSARPPSAAHARAGLLGLGEPTVRASRPSLHQGAPPTLDVTVELPAVEPAPVDLPPMPAAHPEIPVHWDDRARPRRRVRGLGDALLGLRVPRLVGRVAERDRLWRLLHDSRQGLRLVALAGPEAVGRGHLVGWLATRLRESGGLAVRLHAGDIAASVRAELGLGGDAVARTRIRLGALHQGCTPATAERLARVVVPEGARAVDGPDLLAPVAAWLGEIAAHRPLLVWLADAHAGTTAAQLAGMLRRRDAQALVVGTVLADEDAEASPFLALEGLERMALGPLPEVDWPALAVEVLDLEPRTADRLMRLAAGWPFHALQAVRDALARGVLLATPDGFTLAEGERFAASGALAASVRALVDPAAHPAIVLAALLGHHVDAARWREACDRAGLAVPVDAVDALLAARVAGGQRASWHFQHGVVREALAREATPALCLAAAQTLTDHPRAAGRLFVRAGRPEDAIDPLVEAAEDAGRNHRFVECLALADDVEAALDAARAPADDEARGRMMKARVVAYDGVGRTDEANALNRRLLAQARTHGWPRLEGTALDLRAFEHTDASRHTEALADLAEAERVLTACGATRELGSHHLFATIVLSAVNDYDGAVRAAEAAMATDDEPHFRARCLRRKAEALARAGKVEAAEGLLLGACDLFLENDLCVTVATVYDDLGVMAELRGDLATAEARYRESLRLQDEAGFDTANVTINLASLRVLRGDPTEGRDLLAPLLDRLRNQGRERLLVYAVAAWHATLAPGTSWDTALDELEGLLARTRIPDPTFAKLLEIAAGQAEERGERARAARARAIAETLTPRPA